MYVISVSLSLCLIINKFIACNIKSLYLLIVQLGHSMTRTFFSKKQVGYGGNFNGCYQAFFHRLVTRVTFVDRCAKRYLWLSVLQIPHKYAAYII